MASYTTNLNLLKKDPVADASDTFNITTMLNENWDKIDAAMGAARAAEAYSDAKTYAVGDYCTHEGALYRCTTAITAAEAWTAGHWKATSVAAELLAIIASLSNKADKTPPTEYDLPLESGWSGGGKYCKDQFGFVHISGSFTVSTAPNGWSTIATMPAGYRPKNSWRNTSVSAASGNSVYVAIYQNGLVQALMPSGEQNVDVCADFLSEQN